MTSLSVTLTTPTELDAWERTVPCGCYTVCEVPYGPICVGGRVPDPSVSRWYVADRAVETLHFAVPDQEHEPVKLAPGFTHFHEAPLAVVAKVPVLEARHEIEQGDRWIEVTPPEWEVWPRVQRRRVALRLGTLVRLEHPIVECVVPYIDIDGQEDGTVLAPLPPLKPHEIQTIEVP